MNHESGLINKKIRKCVSPLRDSKIVWLSPLADDEYAELAPAAAEQLAEEILVVAGAPACADELKAKGITNFIHVKSNILEELKGYQDKLGI